jgi:hypothetical protein
MIDCIKDFVLRLIIIAAVVCLIQGGCSHLNKKAGLKDDNPIEEFIESVLGYHTGIEVDLSPDSDEE